jgi:serine/threonine-protein kinase
VQHRAGSGKTIASRIKALLLHIDQCHGRAEADAFLLKLRIDREYLADETKLVPAGLWHRALVAFASRLGREEILKISPAIVHPDNLGVWTKVLRGATSPKIAYDQLNQFGSETGHTERWGTEESGTDFWKGRVVIPDSSQFERDGLSSLSRAAELASIPMLFGCAPGKVDILPSPSADTQEYAVRWRAPRTQWLPGLAAAVLICAVGWSLLDAHDPAEFTLWSASALAVGIGLGYLLTQHRRHGTTVASQMFRIQALERAATLRDERAIGTHQLDAGSVVAGQFRLSQQLGSGGSGAIWEAERIADGKTVAIKLLRTAVAHDTVAADRLRREAAALGLAWHPNVVEVYEDGILPDGTSFLVMERLYGESLARRLKRRGAVSPVELLPITLQVCDALSAVHAAGVVHRDLKPGNIFLAEELPGDDLANSPARLSLSTHPGHERVKLLDFGVAQVEWAETRLTNAGAPLGTPGYMSPEQEQGVEVDHRSDIYALGGVIYECLTASPPPITTSNKPVPALSYDVHDESRPESGVQRSLQSVPEAWRRVIAKAMAYHPRDRYADWRGIRDALLQLGGNDTQHPGAKVSKARADSGRSQAD